MKGDRRQLGEEKGWKETVRRRERREGDIRRREGMEGDNETRRRDVQSQ